MRVKAGKKILYLILAIAVCMVLQGFASLISEAIFHHKARFLAGIPGVIVFVKGDSLMTYSSQRCVSLGSKIIKDYPNNTWLGYSSSADGIIILRENKVSSYSTYVLNAGNRKGKPSLRPDSHLTNLSENDAWQLDGDKLCQVVGHDARIELIQVDVAGLSSHQQLPMLPKWIKTCRAWRAAASTHGTKVVFESPAGDVILVDTSSQSVTRLSKGDPWWSDPGWDEPYTNASPYPTFSPDGSKIAFENIGITSVWLRLVIFDVQNKRTRNITVWRPVTFGDICSYATFSNPMQILDFRWIPNTDYLVCEVQPEWSGSSYIFVVRTTTGDSYRLPVKAERFMWSPVPTF